MSKKYLKYVMIILGVIILFVGSWLVFKSFNKNENESNSMTPLMYKVTKNGSNNVMYLFGSIHVTDLKDFDFPKYITDAYNESEYLACEYDIVAESEDPEALEKELAILVYADGTVLKDHMSETAYDKLVEFLNKKAGYDESFDSLKPFFFSSLISNYMVVDAGLSTSAGIDEHFLRMAKADKKKILEVETSEFQLNLLANFPDRLYEIEFIDTLDNYDEGIEELKKLYEAWKRGDPAEIAKMASEDVTEEDKEKYSEEDIKIIEDYSKSLVDDRNITMTDKFEEYFNNGYKTFFMVGAAHLVDDAGIASLLEQRGYTVEQINK